MSAGLAYLSQRPKTALAALMTARQQAITAKRNLRGEISERRTEVARSTFLHYANLNAYQAHSATELAQALTTQYQQDYPGDALFSKAMWAAINNYDADHSKQRYRYLTRLSAKSYNPKAMLQQLIATEASLEHIKLKLTECRSLRAQYRTATATAEKIQLALTKATTANATTTHNSSTAAPPTLTNAVRPVTAQSAAAFFAAGDLTTQKTEANIATTAPCA